MKAIVDTDTLDAKVKSLDSEITNIYTYANNIQTKVDYINANVWQGIDNKTFSIKMRDYVASLKKMAESMQSYSTFVKEYSKDINKTDTKDRSLTIM